MFATRELKTKSSKTVVLAKLSSPPSLSNHHHSKTRYGEFFSCAQLAWIGYKDICKQDLKALGMDHNRWETLTSQHSAWRQGVHHVLSQFEGTLVHQAEAKRTSQKQLNQGAGQGTDWICLPCGRDCHSRIGLLSHTGCCSKSSIQSTLP